MSDFTRTLIVDPDITLGGLYSNPPYFNTIKDAADNLISTGNGGTIIVERGTYTIGDGDTVSVPSHVSIISHGATIEVTST